MLRTTFLLALVGVTFAYIVCPPHYCDGIRNCPLIPACERNQMLGPAGFCGCCLQCITVLRKIHNLAYNNTFNIYNFLF